MPSDDPLDENQFQHLREHEADPDEWARADDIARRAVNWIRFLACCAIIGVFAAAYFLERK